MARSKRLTDEAAQKAAVLASEGLKQPAIASRLRFSQATVSRLLKYAEKRDWLVKRPQCTLELSRIHELRQLIYGEGLEKKLRSLRGRRGGPLLDVRIFDSGDKAYTERLELLAAAAAPYIGKELFPKMHRVGVTWGVTLRFLIDKLEAIYQIPPRKENPIHFFPTCGDPPEVQTDAHRSSSSLVTRLTKCFNGSSTSEFSFSGIGSAIPAIFDREEVATIRKYFHLNPGYRRVFGDGQSRGLLDECDAILTSVGSTSGVGGPWLPSAAEEMSMPAEELRRLTLGNVAGFFLPRSGLNREDSKRLDYVNGRWTGITDKHVERCARRASEKRVGVLMIAASKKADIVMECLRRGLVSRLVIDQELAAELDRALSRER